MTWRKLLAGIVAAALGVAALGWTHALWMPALGWLIVRDQAPASAAPITLVLMGDTTRGRAAKALELYKAGLSGKLALIPERQDPDSIREQLAPSVAAHREFLLACGVAADDLIVVDGCATTSTADEARCLRRYLMAQTPVPAAVTLVTSWYHSSRAGWIFERIFEGSSIEVRVVAASYYGGDWRSWWQLEASFIATFNEYLKWVYWRLKGIPAEGSRA
jgi:uncharacterized SAM-binding protein YcdF (DUF218 family)